MTSERTGPDWSLITQNLGADNDAECRAGGQKWRDTSRVLYGRLRGSTKQTYAAIAKVYPKSFDDYSPRPIPLVPWQARQVANVYTVEPRISYVDPDRGTPLSDTQVATIQKYRSAAGITEAMLATHEECAGVGNGTPWIIPVVRTKEDGSQLLGVRAVVFPAHDQAVVLKDHPESDSERDVTEWRVRMPLPGGGGRFGVALITPTSATWEEAEGNLKGEPIWPRSNRPEAAAGSNPFGQVPAAIMRWSKPEPGAFWANAREDLAMQADALDVAATDFGHIARMQGFGQWFGRLLSAGAGGIKMGPATLIEGTDPQSDLKCVSPTPALDATQKGNDAYLQQTVATNDLNGAALTGSTGITAQAKLVELADRDGLRQRHCTQLARIEQRLYDLMRAGLRALFGVEVLPAARLIVEYSTPPMALDPLHEVQAAERRIALGLSDPYIERAIRDRCSLEEAEKRVKRSREITNELGIIINIGGTGPLAEGDSGEAKPDDGSETKPKVVKAGAPVEDVAKTALNGAQVTALMAVVAAVAAKQLPIAAAREVILASFPLAPTDVDKMLAPLKAFEPAVQPMGVAA